ncbi:MAG: hypothetical protein H7Y17_01920 [Chlorobia bacterium]|nr:hypothetical protein [Fimbriimonadaceae bacterium]
MFASVLCWLVGAPGVTLSIPAASLRDTFAEISKQLPSPIYVEGNLADEVICVHVKDMPAFKLQEALSKVSTGEWADRGGKRILTLPAWKENQQFKDVLEDRKLAIAEGKAKLGEPERTTRAQLSALIAQSESAVSDMRTAATSNWDEYEKARQRLFNLLNGAPASQLLARIIQRVNSDDLATLEPGIRTCYSTSPNRVQKAFPFKIAELLATFRKEQTFLKQQIRQPTKFNPELADDWRYLVFEASPDCSELLLIVQNDRTTNLPTFLLHVADSEGIVHATTSQKLTRSNPKTTAEVSLPVVDIPFSDHQRRLGYALTSMLSPQRYDPKIQRPIREVIASSLSWLSQPEKNEPLVDLVGPSLISVAKQSGKDLVALLPDRALNWRPTDENVQSSELTTRIVGRNAPNSFTKPWDAVIENSTDLLTIRPRLPWEWRDERIDRRALGRLFRGTLSQGVLTALESAIYLGNSGSSTAYEFWSYDRNGAGFAEPMQGSYASRDLSVWYHRDTLKLLGSMPEHQLRSFLNGGEVGLPQLGRQNVERCLFGRDHIDNLFADKSVSWIDRKLEDRRLSDEVWEKLPNGVPGSFKLVCRRADEDFILVEEADVKLVTNYEPEEFGQLLANTDRGHPDLTLQLGKATSYEITFSIGPGLYGTSELGEVTPGSRKSFKEVDELPERVRQQIARGLQDEKRRLAARKEPINNGVPPPAR